MLTEKDIEVGGVAKATHLSYLINGATVLTLEQILGAVQSAKIQKIVKGAACEISQIPIQLGSADGKLPRYAFRGNIVHIVFRHVLKDLLNIKGQTSVNPNLLLGT